MITKEEFIKYISLYQKFNESVERLEKSITGRNDMYFIYETDWCEAVGKMLDTFLDSHFTNYKAAYVKQEEDMFNEEKEIRYPLDTMDELWSFLQTDIKAYFKNAD